MNLECTRSRGLSILLLNKLLRSLIWDYHVLEGEFVASLTIWPRKNGGFGNTVLDKTSTLQLKGGVWVGKIPAVQPQEMDICQFSCSDASVIPALDRLHMMALISHKRASCTLAHGLKFKVDFIIEDFPSLGTYTT